MTNSCVGKTITSQPSQRIIKRLIRIKHSSPAAAWKSFSTELQNAKGEKKLSEGTWTWLSLSHKSFHACRGFSREGNLVFSHRRTADCVVKRLFIHTNLYSNQELKSTIPGPVILQTKWPIFLGGWQRRCRWVGHIWLWRKKNRPRFVFFILEKFALTRLTTVGSLSTRGFWQWLGSLTNFQLMRLYFSVNVSHTAGTEFKLSTGGKNCNWNQIFKSGPGTWKITITPWNSVEIPGRAPHSSVSTNSNISSTCHAYTTRVPWRRADWIIRSAEPTDLPPTSSNWQLGPPPATPARIGQFSNLHEHEHTAVIPGSWTAALISTCQSKPACVDTWNTL